MALTRIGTNLRRFTAGGAFFALSSTYAAGGPVVPDALLADSEFNNPINTNGAGGNVSLNGWYCSSFSWASANGKAIPQQGSAFLWQDTYLQPGAQYRLTLVIATLNAGYVRVALQDLDGSGSVFLDQSPNVAGTYTYDFTYTTNNAFRVNLIAPGGADFAVESCTLIRL